jgi:hypothetical protein
MIDLGVFADVPAAERLEMARQAAKSLGLVLAAVDAGELETGDVERAYMVGLRTALDAIAA